MIGRCTTAECQVKTVLMKESSEMPLPYITFFINGIFIQLSEMYLCFNGSFCS